MNPKASEISHRKKSLPHASTLAGKTKAAHRKIIKETGHPGVKPLDRPALLLLEHFPAPNIERITLAVYFPNAKEVMLAGSFNDWNPSANPLQSQGDGRWVAELELTHGTHEYRFVVDGNWTDDPMALAYTPNPFGTFNCVLLVKEYPHKRK